MREELRARLTILNPAQRTFMLLAFMAQHGQSVIVGWGEDDGLWECSWISGGERFTSHKKYVEGAVESTARKVYERMIGQS